MIARFLALVSIAVVLGACGSQNPAATTTQVSAKGGGCQVDAKKICQDVRNEPATMGGYQTDAPMIEQNLPVTADLSVPLKMPDGTVAAQVVCHIKTRQRSVVYARVTKPPQTEREIEFLREQGLCAD